MRLWTRSTANLAAAIVIGVILFELIFNRDAFLTLVFQAYHS